MAHSAAPGIGIYIADHDNPGKKYQCAPSQESDFNIAQVAGTGRHSKK
jgi:hypothetical protein